MTEYNFLVLHNEKYQEKNPIWTCIQECTKIKTYVFIVGLYLEYKNLHFLSFCY